MGPKADSRPVAPRQPGVEERYRVNEGYCHDLAADSGRAGPGELLNPEQGSASYRTVGEATLLRESPNLRKSSIFELIFLVSVCVTWGIAPRVCLGTTQVIQSAFFQRISTHLRRVSMKYMINWFERPQGSPEEYENAQKRILEVLTQ